MRGVCCCLTVSGYELDHVMYTCPRPLEVVDAFERAGFKLRAPAPQPNTGASHAIAFFDNAYLEVAWPTSNAPAFTDAPRQHFGERAAWDQTGWCPFGISFRSIEGGKTNPAPIPSWGYAAPFLPAGAVPIPIGDNSEIPEEPLLITSLVSGRPDDYRQVPALQHHLGLTELTGLRLTLTSSVLSDTLQAACDLLPIALVHGDAPHLELVFGDGRTGRRLTLGPGVPLTFSW